MTALPRPSLQEVNSTLEEEDAAAEENQGIQVKIYVQKTCSAMEAFGEMRILKQEQSLNSLQRSRFLTLLLQETGNQATTGVPKLGISAHGSFNPMNSLQLPLK